MFKSQSLHLWLTPSLSSTSSVSQSPSPPSRLSPLLVPSLSFSSSSPSSDGYGSYFEDAQVLPCSSSASFGGLSLDDLQSEPPPKRLSRPLQPLLSTSEIIPQSISQKHSMSTRQRIITSPSSPLRSLTHQSATVGSYFEDAQVLPCSSSDSFGGLGLDDLQSEFSLKILPPPLQTSPHQSHCCQTSSPSLHRHGKNKTSLHYRSMSRSPSQSDCSKSKTPSPLQHSAQESLLSSPLLSSGIISSSSSILQKDSTYTRQETITSLLSPLRSLTHQSTAATKSRIESPLKKRKTSSDSCRIKSRPSSSPSLRVTSPSRTNSFNIDQTLDFLWTPFNNNRRKPAPRNRSHHHERRSPLVVEKQCLLGERDENNIDDYSDDEECVLLFDDENDDENNDSRDCDNSILYMLTEEYGDSSPSSPLPSPPLPSLLQSSVEDCTKFTPVISSNHSPSLTQNPEEIVSTSLFDTLSPSISESPTLSSSTASPSIFQPVIPVTATVSAAIAITTSSSPRQQIDTNILSSSIWLHAPSRAPSQLPPSSAQLSQQKQSCSNPSLQSSAATTSSISSAEYLSKQRQRKRKRYLLRSKVLKKHKQTVKNEKQSDVKVNDAFVYQISDKDNDRSKLESIATTSAITPVEIATKNAADLLKPQLQQIEPVIPIMPSDSWLRVAAAAVKSINGITTCKRTQPMCQTCHLLKIKGRERITKVLMFDDEQRPQWHTISQPMTCTTSNVVYVIACSVCRKPSKPYLYVGQTLSPFHLRINQHRNDCDRGLLHKGGVVSHFSTANHAFQNNAIAFPLEHNPKWTEKQRRQREVFWMNSLNTIIPNGLNVYLKQHYTALHGD